MDIQVPILENRGYKTHMLGNIKLVGGLLARGMLAAKARVWYIYVHEWLILMVNLGKYIIEYLGCGFEVRGFIYGSLHNVGEIFDEI